MTGISDACAREAAWLATTASDGLPNLLTISGGAWEVIQAYWPAARLAEQKRGIYVCFARNIDQRPNDLRVRQQHSLQLKIVWPVKTGAPPIAETEQANCAAAIEALIERIRGPFNDKSHGGRFLSVGEVPDRAGWPTVVWQDPERTIPTGFLRVSVTYNADDLELMG